jgi:hypothetical protein
MSTSVIEEFRDEVETIPDEVLLFRRVDWDKIGGRSAAPSGVPAKLNGNCFTDYPEARAREKGLPGPCMSVGVASVLDQYRFGPDKLLEEFDECGIAVVRAGDLRQLKRVDGTPCPQGIMLNPTEKEPWHGVVFDVNRRPRRKAICKAIAQIASWAIPLVKIE